MFSFPLGYFRIWPAKSSPCGLTPTHLSPLNWEALPFSKALEAMEAFGVVWFLILPLEPWSYHEFSLFFLFKIWLFLFILHPLLFSRSLAPKLTIPFPRELGLSFSFPGSHWKSTPRLMSVERHSDVLFSPIGTLTALHQKSLGLIVRFSSAMPTLFSAVIFHNLLWTRAGCSSVVEHLPSMCTIVSSVPCTPKTNGPPVWRHQLEWNQPLTVLVPCLCASASVPLLWGFSAVEYFSSFWGRLMLHFFQAHSRISFSKTHPLFFLPNTLLCFIFHTLSL
jgi:hypothetical protein